MEVDGDEIELELELKWSTSGRAPAEAAEDESKEDQSEEDESEEDESQEVQLEPVSAENNAEEPEIGQAASAEDEAKTGESAEDAPESVDAEEAPRDAPLEDQVRWLRDRVDDLQGDLAFVRSSVGEAERRMTEQIGEVHADAQRRDSELSNQIREVATGTVKRELKGLLLVGVGSILSAVPGLLV